MLKKTLYVIVIGLLVTAGCSFKTSNTQNSIQQNNIQNNTHEIDEGNQTEIEQATYKQLFHPPDFLIEKFDITYADNQLEFIFEYRFSDKLYSLLKDVNYGFIVVYSEKTAEFIQKKSSEILKAEKINPNGQLRYSVQYSEHLPMALTNEQVEWIKNDMDFNLYVLDANNEIFQIINGFRYFVFYDEEESDSIFLE